MALLAVTTWAWQCHHERGPGKPCEPHRNPVLGVVVVLAIVVYAFNLSRGYYLLNAHPRKLNHLFRASRAGLRASGPAAMVGVGAVWFAAVTEWAGFSSIGWTMAALGVVHLMGSVAALVAVLFSGSGSSTRQVVNVASTCAVLYVEHVGGGYASSQRVALG